jgi:2-iminobutanoate/2-iminopropanoate deaminase
MLTAPVKIETAVALVGFLLSYPALAQAPSAARETIYPTGVTPGSLPFSPGIRVENMVYVSGQVAGEAGPDFREQTAAAVKKVQAIVEAAGTTMASVDKCIVFLTRQSDFVVMNEVWRGAFPTNPPARSTVIVAALARPEFLIEMECTAHK